MTVYPFTPSAVAPFQFQPILDGQTYTAVVTWNVAGQRWYLAITTLQGDLVVNLPLIGSPAETDINLVRGYFSTSSLVYRATANQFEVVP